MNKTNAIIFLFLILFAAQAQVVLNSVVATVGNEPITLLGLKQYWLVSLLESEIEFVTLTPTQEILQETLEMMIEERLLRKFAEQKNISVNDKDLEEQMQKKWEVLSRKLEKRKELKGLLSELGMEEDQLKSFLRERERTEELIAQLLMPRLNLTQQEIDAFTEKLAREKKPQTTYRLSQIFLKCKVEEREGVIKKAYDILRQLEEGGDFSYLARIYSEDSSAEMGGDLGYLDSGQFDPKIEAAVKDQPAGKIIGPIIGEDFIRIIKITDKLTPRENLFRQKYFAEKNSLIQQLKQRACVKIFF